MNELVLLILAIAASYVKINDRMPALVFCVVCYIHYFVTINTNEPGIYFVTAIFDLIALKMVTTLNGVMRSKFNVIMCRLLVLSAVIQSLGFLMYHANWPISAYNNMAYLFYFVVACIFFYWRGGNGIIDWHPRFLRDNSMRNKNTDAVRR